MKELKQMVLNKHSTTRVVENIKLKKRLLEAGDESHKNIKLAILWGGGAMRGTYGAGVALGFYLMGYREVFDQYFGISAGAANAAYLLSNQSDFGLTIYLEDLKKPDFINIWRALAGKSIANIDYVNEVLRYKNP